jgi:hypothetical protein
MSTPHQYYPYSQLPEDDTFRYLILQPGAGEVPLVCSLQTAQIADTEYYAISYVWGDDIRDQTIMCENYVVMITPNLSQVLRRVRLPNAPLVLWADSICINQEDRIEKGHQVSLMGKIYRSAKSVLLYIGSDDEGHGPAVCSLLDEVDNVIQSTCKGIDMTWDSFPEPDEDDALLTDPRWNSLCQLLGQSWFDRGWVVQEAALATHAEVLWGQSTFEWQKLMRTYIWLRTRGGRIFSAVEFNEVLINAHTNVYLETHKDFARAFYSELSWGNSSILRTLNCAKELDLGNPRDRIYAFMELPNNDQHGITIRPDYFASYFETYRRFAIEYIRSTKSTELLEYVCHYDVLESDIPSWVPRWDISTWSITCASSIAQPPMPSNCAPTLKEDGKLNVRGFIFDAVHYVSEPCDWETTTTETVQRIWRCINTRPVESPYTGPEAAESYLLDAFLDALCAGTYDGDWPQWRQDRNLFALEARLKQFHMDDDQLSDSVAVNACDDGFENLFLHHIRNRLHNRRFILTKRGYMGLGPLIAHEGDICGIIFGCKTPCLLRKAPQDPNYKYLGATALMGKGHVDLEGDGVAFVDALGSEQSEDWADWDVEEQDIYLC